MPPSRFSARNTPNSSKGVDDHRRAGTRRWVLTRTGLTRRDAHPLLGRSADEVSSRNACSWGSLCLSFVVSEKRFNV